MISMEITKLTEDKKSFWIDNKKLFIKAIATISALALWIIIWWIAAINIDIDLILPTPFAVFNEMLRLPTQAGFATMLFGSASRVFSGYALGILLGAVLAYLAHFFYPLKAFLSPFIKIITAIPVASFILLCMLWMANEITAVFVAFLMVLPIVYGNVLSGLKNTDRSLIEVAVAYGFTPVKKAFLLYIPSLLPYFGSAAVTTVGLAWKAAISAEIMCVTARSIGYYIYQSQSWETEKMFALTIYVILLSIVSEYLIKGVAYLIKRYTKNRFGGDASEK